MAVFGAAAGAERQAAQVPQWAVVSASVSHSSWLWLVCEQSAWLRLHELLLHEPPVQAVPVLLVVLQTLPQAPQLAASVCRSLQVLPLQTVKLTLQLRTQLLAVHVQAAPFCGKLPHPTLQAVQLPEALAVTSQPSLLAASELQSKCVESHAGVHTPAMQLVDVAPAVEQILPQAPQLLASL
jgi:hypothetical protein